MAYALGFPKDITDQIYDFRDPKNWNGDKYKTTPLGALFKTGELLIVRRPSAPYFQYWKGEIYKVEDCMPDGSQSNLVVWQREDDFHFEVDVARVWLSGREPRTCCCTDVASD